jgi:HK97 family phage major capsid protein/HK97 family phage prohead protease
VVNRAYAIFHVKAVDAERRILSGVATTPEPDRVGDIIEPLGVSFKNPLPLLLYHDTKRPVGWTRFRKPTKDGIEFEASLPTIEEPGTLRDRVEEAWQSVKSGLISGVSIGFRSIEEAFNKETNGFRFLKTEVVELSLVTVPANASATIHSIKALDVAASGQNSPGDTGSSPVVRVMKDARPMTIPEQITAFENSRAAKAARMNELMTKASESGSTLDDAQAEEYDTLDREVKSVDVHLARIRDLEKQNIAAATRVTTTVTDQEKGALLRGGENQSFPRITVTPNVPKGTAFARMCMAIAAGHGDSYQTLQYAKQWKDSTPEVEDMVQHMWRTKTAVAAGTTTDSTWAGPLAVRQPLNDFLELLRPRTLLGRISGLKQVPFNISIPTQTTGGTYGWVGQNKPKPVTKADYLTVTLDFNKVAGIIVLSEELVMLSTPSAENLVREEMIAGMSAFLDQQFADPAVAVSAGVNPASITNGAATIASSGVTGAAAKTDLASRVAVFVAANFNLGESVWLMNEANAFGIGMSVNGLGQPLFPGFNGTGGGKLMGVDTVISNNVGARVILMHSPSVLYADEGGVRIDASREASVQMDTAPTDTVDATTVYLSLWQRNLIGLKAERVITWKLARAAAVTYVTTASPYNGT